jgi:hypothetical protein
MGIDHGWSFGHSELLRHSTFVLRHFFSNQLYGEINRRNHAVWTRDSFAGNFERGAVIGTGTGKRKAKCHIHTFVKGVKFQWDQTLIVIHAEHRIEFTFNCTVKNCVGRVGTGKSSL